jgi:hypothetical protein
MNTELAVSNNASLLNRRANPTAVCRNRFNTRFYWQRVCRSEMEKSIDYFHIFCVLIFAFGLIWRGACASTGKFATREAASSYARSFWARPAAIDSTR